MLMKLDHNQVDTLIWQNSLDKDREITIEEGNNNVIQKPRKQLTK